LNQPNWITYDDKTNYLTLSPPSYTTDYYVEVTAYNNDKGTAFKQETWTQKFYFCQPVSQSESLPESLPDWAVWLIVVVSVVIAGAIATIAVLATNQSSDN